MASIRSEKEIMTHGVRYDCSCMQGEAYITPEGYIRAKAIVTRAGVFDYANADGSLRRELRLPEDVFHSDAMSTIKMIPITNGHPIEKLVNSRNAKQLAVGYTGDIIEQQGDYVLANLVITDEAAVKAVKEMGRRELSLGYTVDLVEEPGNYLGQDYDYIQKNIKYNHLAIVDEARAGNAARIHLDEADAIQVTGVKEMAKRKIKIDAMDYMVEPEIADFVESAQERDTNHEEEIRRVEEKIAALKEALRNNEEELERVKAERDGLKEDDMPDTDDMGDVIETDRKSMKMDKKTFNKAVSDRVKLYKVAAGFLSNESVANLDSASNIEIKKQVIKQVRKNICLDGKSEIYIETLFDVLVDEKTSKVNTSNVTSNEATKLDEKDPDISREKMIKNLTTHKYKAKV